MSSPRHLRHGHKRWVWRQDATDHLVYGWSLQAGDALLVELRKTWLDGDGEVTSVVVLVRSGERVGDLLAIPATQFLDMYEPGGHHADQPGTTHPRTER